MNQPPLYADESPWPHRWAVTLVCATFPLIWIGGLVTTYKAGMAVPDWPNTYGYNLFLYPWQTWIYGPFNLFIEHGHRLFASVVGMIAICLVISTWRSQKNPLIRWLSVVALVAVIAQGLLGGLRVIEDEVLLAKIHACFGPAFFALSVAVAFVTSKLWRHGPVLQRASLDKVERYAVLTTLLAYCALVLGSQLRHLSATARPGDFRIALVFHLAVAAALLVHIMLLAVEVYRKHRGEPSLFRPAMALALLIAVQLGLGTGTWITKYGWPSWFGDYQFAATYTVVADSRAQAWITTAHVATGSLILATSFLVALRSVRYAWRAPRAAEAPKSWLVEVAR